MKKKDFPCKWAGKKNRIRRRATKAAAFVLMTAIFTTSIHKVGTARTSTQAAGLAEMLWEHNVQGIVLFAQSYEEKLKEAEDRKKALEQKKAEIGEKMRELNEKKDDLLAYIEELDMQIAELDEEIEELNGQILTAQEELGEAQTELEAAIITEEKQYEAMKRRVQYMYENGGNTILDLFLGASSLAELSNRLEYQSKITDYDRNLLASYTQAKLEVDERKKIVEAQLANLEVLLESAEVSREAAGNLASEKSAEVEVYLAQIELDEETFADYAEQILHEQANIEDIKEEERKRIEEEERRRKEEEERRKKEEEERRRKAEEAAKLAAQNAAKAESESDAKRLAAADNVKEKDVWDIDSMIWPLPGDGRIYAYFGPRKAPTAGASTYHKGLDIGGVYGARIVAVLSGTVIEAQYNASRGNYVAIDHGNGYVTYYMHSSKLLVSPGDKVKQGTVIALVGSTGISTGPHVHFSVAVNGTYVDPLKYVKYE